MKRFHVHVGVKDIEESVKFYSTLFGQMPSKLKADYAKWMLEDPKVNFAISTRANTSGVDHLGIQVDEDSELLVLTERLRKADLKLFAEGEATCCYAESKKAWVQDPSGLPWEAYHTMADAAVFNEEGEMSKTSACCLPSDEDEESSCC